MATIKKHISKSGQITYYIRTYNGYDCNGKQIEKSMTWKPSDGMSDKQIEKELQRQVVKFEDAVKEGQYYDSNIRFGDYGEDWLEMNRPPQLAPKTYECYRGMFRDIKEALGDIKLVKLQSRHLQMFYSNLRENGVKRTGAYAVSDKIDDLIKQMQLSKNKFAAICGVSSKTICAVCKPDGHISIKSAEKIAKGLNLPVQQLFKLHQDTGGLSDKTILHYHKFISTILAQATRDRLIPFNIADRNHMKAPKLERKEAAFLDDEQVRHVLELLENEPIKWKTIMYLLIYSGIRRGELLGLEWKDISFEKKVISIRRTSQAVERMGIITKSPKNDTSYRTIKLSDTVLDLLREYQQYWQKRRTELDDYWQDNIQIILADGSTQTVPNDRLFTKVDSTPMNPYSVSDWVRKFVKRNNLPYFTPHSLRHTHATLLIAEGVSIPTVSRRLGHSSIATTSKIYIHAIQSADEIASNALEDKLKLDKHKEDESI
ncbi:site-specific integrase [uncultured Ruminococcus sp.]|uniref:site-specific integrase n=1 Tax=uncultured Ruminococcus sp. TaxID=165186 RepID=UPI00261A806B|nr:site-specific integrase [uncultured Ruminococcus sp.]